MRQQLRTVQRNRRRFLRYLAVGTGTGLGGAMWWVSASKQKAARWARRLLADAHRKVLPAPYKPEPAKWSDDQVTLAWLGHTTVLINFYGIHILTDPALANRVGVSLGFGTAGPKRYIAPALRFKDLPSIDVLLLSHAHMDHMDLPTLSRFERATFTVTAKTTDDLLTPHLKHVTELSWNGRTRFQNLKGDLEIEAVEVKHWGQRWPSEVPRGYNGYLLRREGKVILFGGDTALTPSFRDLRSRGQFDLAIMPIGAYQPWIWNHCTPEQALAMANAAGAQYILPVHHQTFRLSDEPMNEPSVRLKAALEHEPERLALSKVGETFVLPG
jgi:L-ascorbate metabolism protein UlaG (beta-lactamase superfamily)